VSVKFNPRVALVVVTLAGLLCKIVVVVVVTLGVNVVVVPIGR